ncbi:MAG: DNA mismatch repair protein MutS [Treponema sp.]|nr:DNA mismatch repair protein MutS [Treponema sp.]
MAELTPLMEQYNKLKNEHKNEILLFRLGDFYEMFDEDAKEVSRLINLTLTHRGSSPMCGIPYHAAKVYIARLLRLGKKLAIAEQIGEISPGGGLTERKVIEVITPGTVVDDDYLEQGSNNFLAALSITKGRAGFAFVDVSTSEFMATSWPASKMADSFLKELNRASPRELLLPQSLRDNQIVKEALASMPAVLVSFYPDWHFSSQTSFERLTRQFKTKNLASFSLDETSAEVAPAGFLLDYLDKTACVELSHLSGIKVYHDSDYVLIDDSSMRNLEILKSLRDGSSKFTLLECVNYTLTAMGNRAIRQWLSFPLVDIKKISARQNHVSLFFENESLLQNVRTILAGVFDIERLAGRIAMKKAHAKDLVSLAQSLSAWLQIQEELSSYDFGTFDESGARFIIDLIGRAICDDPSTVLAEGRVIKSGFSPELDRYREIRDNFSKILDEYLAKEIEETGIQNLRIKSNNANGYFLEVTRGRVDKVPSHFIMRRSLTNADRYTTERLQELEKELNSANANIVETERELYLQVRSQLEEYVPYLLNVARAVSYTDAACSFAYAARVHRWVKPIVDDSLDFFAIGGRHPVVEGHLPSGEFVPNDLNITACSSPAFLLITGPNMAGKSTYLRQNALIALLAQTGSYVPASSAKIGFVDKIFCRVGASDNLARGESTFLVEMTETSRILRGATERSLVIMDEVGRGTSTEDGLSIAWAVSEHLLNNLKCRSLFATHYHELSRLEHPAIKPMCMDVKETEGNVVFLRKIKEGASQNSYGIHVARLAGIPQSVIDRANQILKHLQSLAADSPLLAQDAPVPDIQEKEPEQSHFSQNAPGLFSDEEIVLDEILSADIDNITPMSALQLISRWKKALSGR